MDVEKSSIVPMLFWPGLSVHSPRVSQWPWQGYFRQDHVECMVHPEVQKSAFLITVASARRKRYSLGVSLSGTITVIYHDGACMPDSSSSDQHTKFHVATFRPVHQHARRSTGFGLLIYGAGLLLCIRKDTLSCKRGLAHPETRLMS
jgi:hypothetical protein